MKKLFVSKRRKQLLIFADIFIYAIVCLLFSFAMMKITLVNFMGVFLIIAPVYVVAFYVCGLYNSLWEYAEGEEMRMCILGTFVATILSAILLFVEFKLLRTPLGVASAVFLPLVCGFVSTVLRTSYRYFRFVMNRNVSTTKQNVMIVGAGVSGHLLIKNIAEDPESRFKTVCLVDDDPAKHGMKVRGIKISGDCSKIPELCEKHKIDTIILAIPTATSEQINKILDYCKETSCKIERLPPNMGIGIKGSLQKSLQTMKIEDLLSRDTIGFDNSDVSALCNGRTVLVTGAGGSIGSELCRQIAHFSPKKLILLDIAENSTYELQQEFLEKIREGFELDFSIEIASVRDLEKLDMIFEAYKPELVFHAAAHKHVPLMETNPEEAVKNNVFGTFNTAAMADKHGVLKFILISTDKAVNPTNIMGSTKQLAEMVTHWHGLHSKTVFAEVRFGNVLGSNGSVVPIFKKQIEKGGPVTVTHPDIIRYFMTINEAVELVLRAAALANDNEVFVLDMGKPVKIKGLAERMIRLAGYRPYEDIDIEFTGLRPGEKLYEELLMEEEGLKKTSDERIFIGKQRKLDEEEFLKNL
ncbi:MAG: polysaccharide biosynthesis protein, partial [Clostridia bacterium]|nr:polysaccharide biosynthesis protein [Clostridia bacterium]